MIAHTTANRNYNNFDLLRLVAAAQVVFVHSFGFTGLYDTTPGWAHLIFDAVRAFPGVPVFFIISGFLIAKSWERSDGSIRNYFWKRALRIYPALCVCLAVSLVILSIFGYLGREFIASPVFATWIAGQLSFVQFFNPEHFRGFGTGVLNGALWTITVEIQFYLSVPIIYALFFRKGRRSRIAPIAFAILGIGSLVSYALMERGVAATGGFHSSSVVLKLLHNTLIPHFWLFMLGIYAHRHFDRLHALIRGRAPVFLSAYIAAVALIHYLAPSGFAVGTIALLLERSLLTVAVLATAYSWRGLSPKLIRGQDISYGVYIYHYLVINILVELGLMNSMWSIGLVGCISIVTAFASWRLVERPALALKQRRLEIRFSERMAARPICAAKHPPLR